MGGYGSGGGNHNGRPSVQDCFPISISVLRQFGYLASSRWGVLKWGSSSVSMTSYSDHLVLRYTYKGESEERTVAVSYDRHLRNFGGFQTYLRCPCCLRSTTVIYSSFGQFACRKCHGLQYSTQRESAYWRLRTRLDKLAKDMKWEYEWGDYSVPPKPPWMHFSTYSKLKAEYEILLTMYYRLERIQTARFSKVFL
jgi:hypothetical protein